MIWLYTIKIESQITKIDNNIERENNYYISNWFIERKIIAIKSIAWNERE